MRQNPLYPSVRGSDKRDLPLADLRKSLEDPGKDPVSVERSARAVARIWADSLLPQEQGVAYEFYANALLTWLPNKSRNTRRSYAGTLVQFFDFVSRSRSGGGDTLKLVAPHQLRQSDIDGFVAHLTRPSIHPETVIRDKAERLLFEWLQDYFNKNGGAKTDSNKVRDGLKAEGLMDTVSEYHAPLGFKAAASKGYDAFDLAISSLARKRLVRRVPVEAAQLVAATPPKEGEMHPLYGLLPARVESANRAATQIQRVRALSSFWSHLLTDKKLGMSRRPAALEPINPWVEAGSTVKAGTGEDAIRKAQRKMSVEDLTNVIRKLGSERMSSAGKFMTVSSILAVRDELAVFFFVSTGLRRSEGLMALVQNLKEPAGLLALDPGRELMILGGIRRKGKRQDEEVFVPRKILDLRAHMFGMMRQFVDEHDEVVASIRAAAKQQGDDGEKSADMAIARRETFRKSFQAVLMNANQGPLVPALGRWGNAVVKATDKARADKIALPQGDLSQVPMDGRNLLHRMQLLVAGKEERRLKYHPHSLRHLSVTMAEGIGEGSALGQAIAGHRSATTTDIYRDMVSLQAAAVLKVSRRLTDIFMKVEQGLQLAKAPAGAAEMPPVAEQPVAPEVPVEVAPSPEPVVQPEPVETESQKAIQAAQKSFGETLQKAGKPIRSRLWDIANDLVETVGEHMSTPKQLAASIEAADARGLAHLAGEKFGIQPGPEVLSNNVGAPIHTFGTAPSGSPPQAPDQGGRGPKPLNLPKGVQKAKGREETIEARVNAALDSVPTGQWFLDASAWQRNGEWKPVVFMSKEQIEAILASEYMFGPQVVSRYGLTKSPKHEKLNIVMSMRTYLPYIYYATRATEIPGGGTNEPVIHNFDNEMASIEPIPKPITPNAARKKKSADQPADEPKKEKRKIKVFPERLIYLPILNLSNQALVDRFTEVLDYHYDDGKGGGLRVRDPDQAKAMVRWLCILFSASRRVQKEMGDTVSWIGSHDILPKIGETTSQAFNRTRAKVFREPEPEMLANFLVREGVNIYGLLGSNFRVDDEKGRRSMVETRLANVLNDASDYQQGDVASFLSVYKLPDWIDSEDPIGGEKGLPDQELAELKQWLRTVGSRIKSAIEFDEQAEKIEQFWALIGPFSKSDARTIEVPENLDSAAKRFNRLNQVDLILGVRRCLRNLWDLRKSGQEDFMFRAKDKKGNKKDSGVVHLDRINDFWGLYWSWILPSPAEAKERLRKAGTALTKDSVRNIIEVMMMETSSKVILQRFQVAFDAFTTLAQKHINNTALDKRKAAAMIEAEAAKMSKDIAEILFKGDVLTDSAAETVKRALEKYDRLLVTTGFEGATVPQVEVSRKMAKRVAKSMAFDPGEVSYADLKDIYESGTSRLSAVIASSAILTLMAAKPLMDMREASSSGIDDGSTDEPSLEDEIDVKAGKLKATVRLAEGEGRFRESYYGAEEGGTPEYLSKTARGKVGIDITDLEDVINSEFESLFNKLTPSQREDPRFLRLQEKINSGLRGYAAVSSSGVSKEALKAKESYERRILIPIAKSIRGLDYQMSKEAPPPELMPAKASEVKRPPPPPVEEETSIDLFQDAIEPIEKEDPRWVDYTADPGVIDKMVSDKFSSLPEHLREKASRVLIQASAKLDSYGVPRTRSKKETRNALALGIYHRLLDIEASISGPKKPKASIVSAMEAAAPAPATGPSTPVPDVRPIRGRRIMVEVSQPKAPSATPPDEPKAAPSVAQVISDEPRPVGLELLSKPVLPIRQGSLGWMDYSTEPKIIYGKIRDAEELLSRSIPPADRIAAMNMVKSILNPARIEMAGLDEEPEERNSWALGIYWRLIDLIEFFSGSKMTPNRDTRMDTMSADLLATPQVMLVQQIKLRIPLLLAVIFS